MRIIILSTIFFLSQLTFSQSIASYNTNATKYDKNAKFAQIIEKTSFYNSDGIKTEIEHKDFNTSMQLTKPKKIR